MTPYQCYPKVPLRDLPAELREQALPLNTVVIREREKDQPYSLSAQGRGASALK